MATIFTGQLPAKGLQDSVQLTAQVAAVATNTGVAAVALPRPQSALVLELKVTAAATAAGDTLDVFVQTMLDGTSWVDVCHFTQILGNGGAKTIVAKITASQAEAVFATATALGAAAVRNLFGDTWRVRWTIATATAPSFAFTVWALPM